MQSINIVTSRETAQNRPHLYYAQEDLNASGFMDFTEVTIPIGVGGFNRRPSHVEDHHKRHYFAGQFRKVLTFTEFLTLHISGIRAPANPPGLAAVAGGTINASNQIGYISFRHKNGSTIIHEGNLSDGSAIVVFDGSKKRQWTLPGGSPEERVTHVVLWVSVDGALPKEVAELPIFTTTYTENTATGALGNPPPVDVDGNLKQARGVPPYVRFIVKYHQRMWYGGDPAHPSRWWYSELREFESVGDLNYLDHLENETVVGGGAAGDTLASFGASVAYAIQGWDEADFRIYKTSPSIGLVNHFGIVNINEILWFPSELGYFVYVPGAGFRPLMTKDLLSFWRDQYEQNPTAFEDCFAENDRGSRILKCLIPMTTNPKGYYFVAHYQHFDPSVGEGDTLPDWTFDFRDRADYTMGTLRPAGKRRRDLYTGSTDGLIRKENVVTNIDDDGDTYQKLMQWDTPHYFPKEQEGSFNEGGEFNELTLFLNSEYSAFTIEGRAGGDQAYLGVAAWHEDVKASLEVKGNRTRTPKTDHYFRPTGLAGKGVMFRVKIPKADRVEYRGIAVGWGDSGTDARPWI
jgi:hypothetical protein